MPSNAELKEEVRELRILVHGRPEKGNCLNSCPHGMRYHGGPICWGELNVNTQIVCACPLHPDDPPISSREVL